jgi:hypothetical protein
MARTDTDATEDLRFSFFDFLAKGGAGKPAQRSKSISKARNAHQWSSGRGSPIAVSPKSGKWSDSLKLALPHDRACGQSNRHFQNVVERTKMELVGARGFEPRTPCAQGRCATRLRYAPT